jgi:hypothetical protein
MRKKSESLQLQPLQLQSTEHDCASLLIWRGADDYRLSTASIYVAAFGQSFEHSSLLQPSSVVCANGVRYFFRERAEPR